ncbi:MAG: hypothetical protein L0Y78_07420, partial [candidate division NC10 bacterium]|nr:hypothetical protein [candidate division NC10 bacterium]
MNIQRILLAVAVLALTVGCTWAATEASDTTGFAVIPDSEAAQIRGGLGWDCNDLKWTFDYSLCDEYGTEEDCTYWVIQYETWGCEPAPSGQCDP